jgi:hypothetical protein
MAFPEPFAEFSRAILGFFRRCDGEVVSPIVIVLPWWVKSVLAEMDFLHYNLLDWVGQ